MPEPINPRGQDNPSTYFVQDKNSEAEMIRILIQDALITAGMGGPLAEQPDPSALHRILDIGCGPGGWMLELAGSYPHMALIGIDISWKMIEYARAQSQAQKLTDGVEFLVMDALQPLEFPDASFDLVNIRFGPSYLSVHDWPRLIGEMRRVLRPGGIARITNGEDSDRSNSPAYTRLTQMLLCALYRADNFFNAEGHFTEPLTNILKEHGFQNIQEKASLVEFAAGTVAGQNFYQDTIYAFQNFRPFIQKHGCASDDYDVLCEQAMSEMQRPDFRASWNMVTLWGTKPYIS
jgi:ubiquinone/menaquinone biosynthesis C-methylase UbiE